MTTDWVNADGRRVVPGAFMWLWVQIAWMGCGGVSGLIRGARRLSVIWTACMAAAARACQHDCGYLTGDGHLRAQASHHRQSGHTSLLLYTWLCSTCMPHTPPQPSNTVSCKEQYYIRSSAAVLCCCTQAQARTRFYGLQPSTGTSTHIREPISRHPNTD